MVELLNRLCLSVGDLLLGWLLALSPSAALVAVAACTSLVLTWVRRWTTNQDLLGRAAADKRRLKELVREAKQQRDGAALARYRATLAGVGLKQLAAEGKPLLASLVPIALLATWSFQRLEFLPPRAGERIEFVLHASVKEIGQVAYVVPQEGVEAGRWIQPISDDVSPPGSEPLGGAARWQLMAAAAPTPYTLQVRVRDEVVEHAFLVGGATYLPVLVNHAETPGWATEIQLRPCKLFGVVPGFVAREIPLLSAIPGVNQLVLAPWLVGYLALVIPLALVMKPLLRIY